MIINQGEMNKKSTLNTNVIEFQTIRNSDGHEENDLTMFLKNQGDTNYYMVGWLWGHYAARHIYTCLNKKLKSFEPNKNNVGEMIKAITTLTEFLENHHHHEQNIIWPTLIEKKPESSNEFNEIINKQHSEWDDTNKELLLLIKSITTDNNGASSSSSSSSSSTTDFSSNEWNETFKSIKENIEKQVGLIYKNFFDEERLVIPIVVTMTKSEQNKTADKINSLMRDAPIGRFVMGAILEAAKNNKDLENSVNDNIPALVRKVLFPLAIEKSYKWFSIFVNSQ